MRGRSEGGEGRGRDRECQCVWQPWWWVHRGHLTWGALRLLPGPAVEALETASSPARPRSSPHHISPSPPPPPQSHGCPATERDSHRTCQSYYCQLLYPQMVTLVIGQDHHVTQACNVIGQLSRAWPPPMAALQASTHSKS